MEKEIHKFGRGNLKEKDNVIVDLQNNNKELEEYADNLAKAVGYHPMLASQCLKPRTKTGL